MGIHPVVRSGWLIHRPGRRSPCNQVVSVAAGIVLVLAATAGWAIDTIYFTRRALARLT